MSEPKKMSKEFVPPATVATFFMGFYRNTESSRRVTGDANWVTKPTYRIPGHKPTIYKSIRTAAVNSVTQVFCGRADPMQFGFQRNDRDRNFCDVPGLVVHFRPEDLEPVEMETDDRIAFYKEQASKWLERIFELGIDHDERVKICEEIALEYGTKMKMFEQIERGRL